MRKVAGLSAILLTVVFVSVSEARGPRGGNVVGPDGVMYNTNSPEWKASGGSMEMYRQIMQQKVWMQQQQFMLKQKQEMQKLQKQGKGKATGFNGSTMNGGINYGTPFVPDFGGSKPKKKRRTYDPTRPVGAQIKQAKPTETAPKADATAAPKTEQPKTETRKS